MSIWLNMHGAWALALGAMVAASPAWAQTRGCVTRTLPFQAASPKWGHAPLSKFKHDTRYTVVADGNRQVLHTTSSYLVREDELANYVHPDETGFVPPHFQERNVRLVGK